MKILIVGFGGIAQAVLYPLIHDIGFKASSISIVSKEGDWDIAKELNISYEEIEIKESNYTSILEKKNLSRGDWILNLSVEVDSISLMKWCLENDVHYLDTCIEPWKGGYMSNKVEETTNYALRAKALSLKKPGLRTCVVAHGANPGIVTHLAKDFIKKSASVFYDFNKTAFDLGIKSIHVAECDTQDGPYPKDVFVNTWSPYGFISELYQKAEIGNGIGIGENSFDKITYSFGDNSGAYLQSQGRHTPVKTWTPSCGASQALLVPHHESSSLAHLLTLKKRERVVYRPTVHYSYVPCKGALESIDCWNKKRPDGDFEGAPERFHLLRDSITSGRDELGLLFVFNSSRKPIWYGSIVDIEYARRTLPYCNATALQTVGGIISGIKWAMSHPYDGVVEAEDMDHKEVLSYAKRYLGDVTEFEAEF